MPERALAGELNVRRWKVPGATLTFNEKANALTGPLCPFGDVSGADQILGFDPEHLQAGHGRLDGLNRRHHGLWERHCDSIEVGKIGAALPRKCRIIASSHKQRILIFRSQRIRSPHDQAESIRFGPTSLRQGILLDAGSA